MLYNAKAIHAFPRRHFKLRGFIKTNYRRVDRSGKDSTISYFLDKRSKDIKTKQYMLPGGVLPYMGYIGMCRCEGYGFQAVYSRIGYINQSVWD